MDHNTVFYLQNNGFSPAVENLEKTNKLKEMRRIKRRAASSQWYRGEIYKKKDNTYPKDRLVPHPDDRARIIEEIHHELGHLGINKVMSILAQRFYFRNMRDTVQEELKKCDACARKKADFKKDPELHPIPPLPSFQRFCMDTLGPFPCTPRGNINVIVAVDHFTKFIEARAIPNKKASETARFADDLICRYLPSVIMTDNGPEFTAEFKKILEHRGVQHVTSTAYRPQSNGMAERSVQNILNALQKIAVEHPDNWDDYLPEIMMGLRTSVQSSTGVTPYFLTFGIHPSIPAELKRTPGAGGDSRNQQHEPQLPHVV